jgi:outer membrane biosynthesis protein TonB
MEANFMKLVGAISTAVLTLTLGVGIPAYAQQEQHDQQEKEKKAQPEKSAKPEEKNARQEEPKNTKPEENKAQQEENKNAKPAENNARQEKNNKEEKNVQEQHSQEAKPAKQEQHASGNGNGRIPDDRYRAHFGEQHRFRVTQSDYSNRRFQYGGYWFGFQGVWPSNWLYTQDVYVVEIDGVYYLCNANYPGVNIMLSVTI